MHDETAQRPMAKQPSVYTASDYAHTMPPTSTIAAEQSEGKRQLYSLCAAALLSGSRAYLTIVGVGEAGVHEWSRGGGWGGLADGRRRQAAAAERRGVRSAESY